MGKQNIKNKKCKIIFNNIFNNLLLKQYVNLLLTLIFLYQFKMHTIFYWIFQLEFLSHH
jgi:hypothetical protein